MTIMPKKLIIDKDTFVGINLDELCNFARNHFLILPLVLHDECATNVEKREELFEKFRTLILSGSHMCMAGRHIVQKEGQTLQPHSSLADTDETNRMRRKFKKGYVLSKPDSVDDIHEGHVDAAYLALEKNEEVANAIALKKLKEAKEKRGFLEANKLERFKFWVGAVELVDIHRIAISTFSYLTDSPEKFCLSRSWVTWHFVRLASVLALDYAFLRKGKGGTKELTKAEHDLHDIEYVYLMSRADGLLTRDKKLVKPLAQAAFPEKDVFSGLDEVPDEYLCHWS